MTVRVALLVLLTGLSGCASLVPVTVGSRGITDERLALTAGPAQTSGGGRVQTRGLPLTRGQKVALWTGVAVLTGYLIADSDDDDEFAFGAP